MAKSGVIRNSAAVDGLAPAGSTVTGAALADQVAWTAVPTLQNSWANVAGYQAAQYKRDFQGVVSLRGQIDTGTKTGGTLLFTLPAGSRPAAKETFTITSEVAAGVSSSLVVDTDGTVKIGTVTVTTAASISLSTVQFDTA